MQQGDARLVRGSASPPRRRCVRPTAGWSSDCASPPKASQACSLSGMASVVDQLAQQARRQLRDHARRCPARSMHSASLCRPRRAAAHPVRGARAAASPCAQGQRRLGAAHGQGLRRALAPELRAPRAARASSLASRAMRVARSARPASSPACAACRYQRAASSNCPACRANSPAITGVRASPTRPSPAGRGQDGRDQGLRDQ